MSIRPSGPDPRPPRSSGLGVADRSRSSGQVSSRDRDPSRAVSLARSPASAPGAADDGVSSLASLIASQRRELGLSLRQLGEQSGVNFSWLSRIENGQARVLPSVDAFLGLASSLQLSIAELLIHSGLDPALVLPSDARIAELRKKAGHE